MDETLLLAAQRARDELRTAHRALVARREAICDECLGLCREIAQGE